METDIRYLHLRTKDPDHRSRLCRAFYEEIYREAFPKSDQAECPDTWLPLMEDTVADRQPLVHIVLACDADEHIFGGVIFELYRETHCWLGTYLAVRTSSRRQGVATGLMAEVERTIRAHGSPDWLLFAEAENPDCMTTIDERAKAKLRLRILDELGMRRLPFDYIQPALRADKHAAHELLLLCYAPDKSQVQVPTRRLRLFLTEFHSALDRSDSPDLALMDLELCAHKSLQTEALALAGDDTTLGSAKSIALRMTFLHAHTVQQVRRWREPRSQREEIRLNALRNALDATLVNSSNRKETLRDHLSGALESFHDDIVTPYTTENSLPLVVMCEPFSNTKTGDQYRPPHHIQVTIPPSFEMEWEEKRTVSVRFAHRDSLIVNAKFVDNVTFFESGYIAYSVSFIFEACTAPVPLNASLLLLLESVAKPAGKITGEPVRFSLVSGCPKPLNEFFKDRLQHLAALPSDHTTVFSLLRKNVMGETGVHLANSLHGIQFPGPGDSDNTAELTISVGIEVIGADRLSDILHYSAEALSRKAPVDAFSKRLAGLAQNVLDFREQDAAEVYDSLSATARIGKEITFAHKDVAVRFSDVSRAHDRMVNVVGGEPYWFLVQLVLGHNEALLSDLHRELERYRGEFELHGMMRELLKLKSRRHGVGDAKERLESTLGRRIRLAHFIPNLFRYRTEQQLYRLISRARGLDAQHAHFMRLEETIESLGREVAVLRKERDDATITRVLLWLSTFQVVAVFAAIASLQDEQFRYFRRHLRDWDYFRFLYDLWLGPEYIDTQRVEHFRAVWALGPGVLLMAVAFGTIGLITVKRVLNWLFGLYDDHRLKQKLRMNDLHQH